MTAEVDFVRLEQSLRDALSLLRQRYAPSKDAGGGWYHQLERPDPGATATAVGLMVFHDCQERFERFDDCLAFLKARQVSSEDPLLDGGWATNTSGGRPVVEATGWVARMIGRTRCQLVSGAPDLARAYSWLLKNQNPDGGWGSVRGCPSRVVLTCLALRALAQLNPYDAAIGDGVEWLMANRADGACAWGETGGAPATVTHTALSLLTLAELRQHDDRTFRAYEWMAANLDPSCLDDPAARFETYRVEFPGQSPLLSVRLALWHYGLPLAVAALLRHPDGPPEVISRSVETILQTQSSGGYWPNLQGGTGISLWGLWWCTQALCDLSRSPPARSGDSLVWVRGAVIVHQADARDRPLTALIARPHHLELRDLFARFWSTLLITMFVLGALGLVAAGKLSWQDFAIGMIFPVALSVVEAVRWQRGHGSTRD